MSEFVEVDEHGVAHSIIGASSLSRVDACPGSVHLHKELLKTGWKGKSSPAAAMGTAVHHFVEQMFLQDLDPMTMDGLFHGPTKYTLTKNDCKNLKWVKQQVEKARKRPEYKDAELMLETKLPLSSVHPESFGTTDIALVNPFGKALLLDYKNGTSKVIAKGNRQLAFYGIGLQDTYGVTDIETGILQPNVCKTVESSLLTVDDLEEERVKVRATIDKAMAPDAPLSMGGHCFFCPAKQAKTCPLQAEAQKKESESLLLPTTVEEDTALEWEPVKIDSNSLLHPSQLSDKQRAQLLINKKLLEDYLKQVYDYSLKTFDSAPLKGFTVAEGKLGNRTWSEGAEEKLKELVREDFLYETTLASPTLLEKRLGSEYAKVSDLVVRKEGSKKLVAIAEPATPKLKTK